MKHIWTIVAMATWVFAGTTVYADGLDTVLSFTPNFLSVEVRENKQNKPQEASINSGLDLQFRTELLQFDVDYKVKVQLKGETHDAAVSRQAAASLYSNSLNRLLGLNADIRAGSTIKQGDGGYAHSVTPGFSKTFSDLATLKVQYKYSLDQANAKAPEQEKSGYRMALSGESQGGRLTWKGNLGSTDVFGGASQLQSTELMEFESHYLLAPDIRLELSGRSKDETVFAGGVENDFITETRYGAGLAWSPSQRYSVAFKVNKRIGSREHHDDIFGSGKVSWYPNRGMEFTLSYGDQLVDGAHAFMFGTKVDLDGS